MFEVIVEEREDKSKEGGRRPTVERHAHIYYLAKSQPRERAGRNALALFPGILLLAHYIYLYQCMSASGCWPSGL